MNTKALHVILLAVLGLTVAATDVWPQSAVFNNPTIGGVALDWCREWGANCGKPAADAFCQFHGYQESSNLAMRNDKPPTVVIRGGAFCQEDFCDRITSVACVGTPITKDYRNPTVDGYGLDFCREWGANCGKPAADAYCRSRGHKGASSYVTMPEHPPTRVIGSGEICREEFCDRIIMVMCSE